MFGADPLERDFRTEPATRLIDEPILETVDAHCQSERIVALPPIE